MQPVSSSLFSSNRIADDADLEDQRLGKDIPNEKLRLPLKRTLEGILGSRVELATPRSLKPQGRDSIVKEALRAA